jgi:hypothetical protein
MKRTVLILLPLCLVGAVLLSHCGKKAAEQQSALEQMQKAAEQSKQAAEAMQKSMTGDKKPVPPVSFKVLMEFLPKSVEGLTAGTPEGETTTMNEWSFAFAKNSFEGTDGNTSANVEIFDYAYISMLYAPYQILLNMNYNRESSKGYERSTKIADSPAFTKWEEESKYSEVTVLISERFIVKCETRGLPDGIAKKIVESIDLKKLATQKAS